jgi:hypothetical protein
MNPQETKAFEARLLRTKDLLSTLPPDTPVVIFCLDNTSFLGLNEDGSMNAISRCVEEDDGFHVRGALVVAFENAMKYFLEQLKRRSAGRILFSFSLPGRALCGNPAAMTLAM